MGIPQPDRLRRSGLRRHLRRSAGRCQYSEQLVRIVVPFSAGSTTDLLARVVAGQARAALEPAGDRGEPAGLAGPPAWPRDRPTATPISNGQIVIGDLNKNLGFDPLKELLVRQLPSRSPRSSCSDSPAKSVKDLIEMARAKPGGLNYSSAGLGSTTGIAGALFKQTTKTDIVHVPFKGLPVLIRPSSAATWPWAFRSSLRQAILIQSGACAGDDRSEAPERAARCSDLQGSRAARVRGHSWFGILAPAGVPKAIVAKASQDIAEVLGMPDVSAGRSPGPARVVAARAVRPDHQGRCGAIYTLFKATNEKQDRFGLHDLAQIETRRPNVNPVLRRRGASGRKARNDMSTR